MTASREVTQRGLRMRARQIRQIMDAVEHGPSFTVTRDGGASGS